MKDYIVLKGADADWNAGTERLQWNNISDRYFPNFLANGVPDGQVDIFMKLHTCTFITDDLTDPLSGTVTIDTNLNFNNMVPTNGSSILGSVDCVANTSVEFSNNENDKYFLTSLNNITSMELKISRFNSIQIGIIGMGKHFNISSLKDFATFVLEIEYIRNNNLKRI